MQGTLIKYALVTKKVMKVGGTLGEKGFSEKGKELREDNGRNIVKVHHLCRKLFKKNRKINLKN